LLAAELLHCGVCGLAYEEASVPLPVNMTSLDCTVTYQGSTRQAVFDCPPPNESGRFACTAPTGLNISDAPVRAKPESSSAGGFLDVSFADGAAQDATTMQDWLGGPDFSLTVAASRWSLAKREARPRRGAAP
jgi:hypothetical protein